MKKFKNLLRLYEKLLFSVNLIDDEFYRSEIQIFYVMARIGA
jgi:hypothetical protein